MRLLFTSIMTMAMLALSASVASAVSFTFQVASGAATPGSPLTLDIYFDTETEQVSGIFMSVYHAGNTASSVANEAFIFVGGLPVLPFGAAPVANKKVGESGDWNYALSPPSVMAPGSGPVKIGSISFASLNPGDIRIGISSDGGAVTGAAGVILDENGLDLVSYETITVVPEPSTALLLGLGLVGLGVAGKRK